MKISMEMNLVNFNAWAGAVDTKEKIIEANMTEEFEAMIDELYPDGIDATELNDLLWFNADWILEALGIEIDIETLAEVF